MDGKQMLIESAQAVAAQRIIVEMLGACNRPEELEKRVAADARFMVERDKLFLLEKDYSAKLRLYGTAMLPPTA